MAGNTLAALKKRRRHLASEIKALQKEMDEIDAVIDKVDQLAKRIDSDGGGSGGVSTGARPAAVISAVVEILREAQMPMTRGQIMAALREREVVIGGSNPANTLGTTLSRNKDSNGPFVNIEGYGYWLKDRRFIQGGYLPPDAEGIQGDDVEIKVAQQFAAPRRRTRF